MIPQLVLMDINPDLVIAWQGAFADFDLVDIQIGNILDVAEYALVSPANSYGFMDGGIDLDYARFFGPTVERRVQEAIARRPEGILPVGASLVVRTGNARIPYLIVAPTMELPERVPPQNCYRAFRAALRAVALLDAKIPRVYCPGMATGVGAVAPDDAAAEMAKAYADWRNSFDAG